MSNHFRPLPAAALTLLAAFAPAVAAALGPTDCQSLVTNGSFETTPQPVPDESFRHFSDVGAENVAGWNLASGSAIEVQRNLNGAAADGEHWIELAASDPTTITQTVSVTPGALYELRFAYSARPFFGDDNRFRVSWAGERRTLQAPQVSEITWQYASVVAAAPEDGTGTIRFRDLSGGNPAAAMFIDDVTLCRVEVCNEELVLPSYLVDLDDPNGTTTLFALRNLTAGPVTVDVEYVAADGSTQRLDTLTLEGFQTVTVNLRDVAGLAADPDGFGRGFVRFLAAGGPDGRPVLAGDFFQVDVGSNFATGNELLRGSRVCRHASVRFLDFGFGGGTRLAVYLRHPRGADEGSDPPSFTVQVLDEQGNPEGPPEPFWTADHAIEITASDLTENPFGTLAFDFTNSLGGAAYAEYSAEGRFSVGVASQCGDEPTCGSDCCPAGSLEATTPELFYPAESGILDCEAAISFSLRDLDSITYRNVCRQAHGGS
ncbi:MAG TPA: DUF642 domain-containing protein, partial [Thermoanaerobaculia bacterium]|nr:DUF642 domain-containing protein [Thermoanaerobaculia bacterium]